MSRPSRARRRAPKPDPRAVLLEVGARLFATRGFDEVSIDNIAAEAGVAKGLLYYYFASKRALYVEIVRVGLLELAERTAPDPSLPPSERTAGVLTALIDWAKDYGGTLRNLIAQGPGDPELQLVLHEARQRQVDMMLAGMREVRADLGLPPVAPSPALRHAIRGWIAFIEAVLTDWLQQPDLTEDELRDLFLHAAGGLLSAAHKAEGHPSP